MMGSVLIDQIAGSVASALVLFLVGSIWKFAKSVRDNTEQIKELSIAFNKHLEKHP